MQDLETRDLSADGSHRTLLPHRWHKVKGWTSRQASEQVKENATTRGSSPSHIDSKHTRCRRVEKVADRQAIDAVRPVASESMAIAAGLHTENVASRFPLALASKAAPKPQPHVPIRQLEPRPSFVSVDRLTHTSNYCLHCRRRLSAKPSVRFATRNGCPGFDRLALAIIEKRNHDVCA